MAPHDGNAVSSVEFANLFIQLIVASNETTRTLLTGTLLALLESPGAHRALEADPALLPVAVEEMLHWTTPVHYFRRTATRYAELSGNKIREGDCVVLHCISGSFDEMAFAEPLRFDIRRDPNPHVTFGWGDNSQERSRCDWGRASFAGQSETAARAARAAGSTAASSS